MGAVVVARGDIWWGEMPNAKGRPFLVVSRDGANAVMARVLVAPITRRQRGIPSELPVGEAEGLPTDSVATFDNIQPIAKAILTRKVGALDAGRRHEICSTMDATFDC